jgi:hypothetical protein
MDGYMLGSPYAVLDRGWTRLVLSMGSGGHGLGLHRLCRLWAMLTIGWFKIFEISKLSRFQVPNFERIKNFQNFNNFKVF